MRGRPKEGQCLWVAVTQDAYQLPIAVADTARELADMVGASVMAVTRSAEREMFGKVRQVKYVRVRCDDEQVD